MINLHENMLPTSAGVEPTTSWSPVGRRIQLSHRGRQTIQVICYLQIQISTVFILYTISTFSFQQEAQANSAEPDQMLQNAASDQGLHCLPFTEQFKNIKYIMIDQ